MAETFLRYGAKWPEGTDDLQVEMACIVKGGRWTTKDGKKCGEGLPHHYEKMRNILWPRLDDHRWHRLCRDEALKNKVTVLMGPGSSGKTHEAAWIYLCEYFCFPQETCVLVSSTDRRGLKLRVWGEISMLWQEAVNRFDYLPGHFLDSAIAITTDTLDDRDADERTVRDMRKGMVGIPTMQGGKFVGLGKWIGIKQKRVRLIADEASLMGISFLSAFSNLNKNEDFRAIILGNPIDVLDPLGKAAEPIDGWDGHMEPEKTAVWKTRFMEGTCINLVGTDSPNFDFPADKPTRYKYLISKEKIRETLSFFPKDSHEYYSQCVGVMKIGMLARRVLTRGICERNQALETEVNWDGPRIRVYAVDSSYGGDRCVGGWGEFGKVVGGKVILLLHPPAIIPISAKEREEPEVQIAKYMKKDCEGQNIIPDNVFHDSTGRGSLGTMVAREWSPKTNPVEFGGRATGRPVSLDLFIWDPKLGIKRLKLCSEHYGKFVTELWFSVRYTVEASQLRGLTEDTMEEFCQREWKLIGDDKRDVEKKEEMKERTGRSPDLADWAAIIVEGARRLGFQIAKMANESYVESNRQWIDDLAKKREEMLSRQALHF